MEEARAAGCGGSFQQPATHAPLVISLKYGYGTGSVRYGSARFCHRVVHGCSAEGPRGPANLEAGLDRGACRRPFRLSNGAIPYLAHHVRYVSGADLGG